MTETQDKKTEILRAFAWRLNSAADSRGLQQSDIAERLGVKGPRVRNWFQGLNRPKKATRLALITLLQVPLDWLFKETTDKDSPPNQGNDSQGTYGDYRNSGSLEPRAAPAGARKLEKMIDPRYKPRGEPSTRTDVENYFRAYCDAAATKNNPNLFPRIMWELEQKFKLDEFESEKKEP